MSIRTLIEINHDAFPADEAGIRELVAFLGYYVRSGSKEHAEALDRYGIRAIGLRHHSSKFVLDGEPEGFPVQYLSRAKETQGG